MRAKEKLSKNVTHVFAMDANSLIKKLDCKGLIRFKAVSVDPLIFTYCSFVVTNKCG